MTVRWLSPRDLLPVSFICLCLLQASASSAQDREIARPEAHWESVSHFTPLDHRVFACMEFGGQLIAGGEFNGAGNLALNHIGSWDGRAWHALGDGLNHPVRCLGIYQGQLIAGGEFTASGERPMSHVARWNGSEWEALGNGMNASPTALIEWNGGLVAGGWFDYSGDDSAVAAYLPYAAWWDGTNWLPMGRSIDFTCLSAPPRDLVVYKGSLYAAGSFTCQTCATEQLPHLMARWDGLSWVTTGPHIVSIDGGKPVGTCFAIRDSLLVVGGSFTRLDTMDVHGVVSFDGQSWASLGSGSPGGVLDLAVHQGHLFAAGFMRASQLWGGVAEWDGTSWTVTSGVYPVRALASHDGLLFAAGEFWGEDPGEHYQQQLGTWDGVRWHALRVQDRGSLSAFPDPIQSLVSFEDHVNVETLTHYSGYGRGLHEYHDAQPAWEFSYTYPYAIFRGSLISGWTTWDGQTAGRLPDPPFWGPQALGVLGDSLLAAGWPCCQPTTGQIWAWNGQTWSLFADGLDIDRYGDEPGDRFGIVRALAPFRNQLVAGGFFSYNDDTGHHLGVWTGTRWNPLGDCPNDMVTCLLTYNNDLIVAGFFDHIGSVEASHIARWDGTQWHAFGLGTDGPIYTLAIHNDRLIAGGFFDHAGGLEAGSIAAWDGEGWIPLKTGVDGEALTMVSNQGTLWVGGEFSKAGGETSFHLAKWIEGPRKAAFSNFTALRDGSRAIIQVSATYLPFDHQGFLIYRQALGEPQVLITPSAITSDEFSLTDNSPPLGPVTYLIAGVASTGAVTQYESTEIDADPSLHFALLPIRPNPFQAQASITFHNAKAGPMHVAVFDLRGRLVNNLVNESLPPGAHTVTWDGRDTSGRSVAAGTYFCRVTGPEGALVERLVRSSP